MLLKTQTGRVERNRLLVILRAFWIFFLFFFFMLDLRINSWGINFLNKRPNCCYPHNHPIYEKQQGSGKSGSTGGIAKIKKIRPKTLAGLYRSLVDCCEPHYTDHRIDKEEQW